MLEEKTRVLAWQWQTAFDAINDGVAFLNLEGRILQCNQALARILGEPPQKIVGRICHELLSTDSDQIRDFPFKRMLETSRRESTDLSMGDKWFRITSDPVLDKAGTLGGAVWIISDITERKKSEQALQRSEARFRRLVDSNIFGIVFVDLDGKITEANDAFLKIVGYTREELLSGKVRGGEMTPPEYRHLDEKGLEEAIATGVCTPFKKEYIRKDGSRIPVLIGATLDKSGLNQDWICFVFDLTEQKRIEEELSKIKDELASQLMDMTHLHELSARLSTSAELQSVLEEVLAAVTALLGTDMGVLMLYDLEQGDLFTVASVGFSEESLNLIGRVPSGVGACGVAIRERCRVIVEDVETDTKSAPHIHAARLAGYRAVCSLPLLSRNNEVVGTIAAYFREPHRPSDREIHLVELYARQAAAVIENARLYREAQEANRIKDEFLAMVSHELRTPLTAMLGWTRLLRSSKLDEAASVRAIEIIERNAKAQAQLVEDLLDVSRIITGKLHIDIRPVELGSVVGAAIDAVRPVSDAKSIRLEVVLDSEVGLVSGDPNRLQQVVWNLLSNAIKFTPRDGCIEIRLERINSQAMITVKDTGQGISADFLPHVFERFRQADASITRSYGGLGLGLAIVHHLVELHGGTIRADSPGEGQGATFTVRLPLIQLQIADFETRIEGSAIDSLDSTILDGLRVLVVDDENDGREMLATLLEQYGAKVIAVASAAEAVGVVELFGPDLLVSDIAMPNEDGYGLIRKIRAREPQRGGRIPALALSAYAADNDRDRALSAGFQMYAPKPIEPIELVRKVAILAGRMVLPRKS